MSKRPTVVSAKPEPQTPQEAPRLSRAGFTLVEMMVVAVIMAIGAAVVVPNWSRSLALARINAAKAAVESEVANLCRVCMRQGKTVTLTVQPGTSSITVVPPMPGVFGDASGVANYSDRFPEAIFSQVDFNGGGDCGISIYGELISTVTGQRLEAGIVTITGSQLTQTADLLVANGSVSVATVTTGTATVPQTATAATTVDAAVASASLVVTPDTTTNSATAKSSKASGKKSK